MSGNARNNGKAGAGPGSDKRTARQERQAAELRRNLLKRKAQQAQRADDAHDGHNTDGKGG